MNVERLVGAWWIAAPGLLVASLWCVASWRLLHLHLMHVAAQAEIEDVTVAVALPAYASAFSSIGNITSRALSCTLSSSSHALSTLLGALHGGIRLCLLFLWLVLREWRRRGILLTRWCSSSW